MKIISHRGICEHSKWKENTLEALLFALQQKEIDGIELDVRMTKDHVLVIHHDVMIHSSSDGTGVISWLTLSELYQYNFGTKKHPSKIATLENLLQNIHSNKEILIEIKSDYEENIMIQKICELLKKYSFLNIKICSFKESILRKIKHQYPKIDVGKITFLNPEKKEVNFNFYSVYYKNISSYFSSNYVWTIKNKKELSFLKQNKDFEVLNIITDIPKTVFYERK